MKPFRLSAYTLTSPLGRGLAAQREALLAGRSGLAQAAFEDSTLSCWTGAVSGLDTPLAGDWGEWDSRNHRLASLALDQDDFRGAVAAAVARHGADRVAVFVGTSTSGTLSTEHAYRERDPASGKLPDSYHYRTTHSAQAAAEFVRLQLGLENLACAICTACSSSAKVFAAASRAIEAGLCDAAVVGGADSLCLTTLHGFNSLQLISADICRPADVNRKGISIGEAAGFALLERGTAPGGLALLGYGESSDAYHMSTPDPEGRGAAQAMRDALARAQLAPEAIGYINLHGTATPANDASEDRAVMDVFGAATPCSSTKGFTGHTLGAAGIVEAVFCLLAIEHGFLPPSLNTRDKDPSIRGNIVLAARPQQLKYALSNSFGFGGNNASLVLGRAP
ncbi:MAG TPA: beta-ketoacyl-[acyl-carrier-protein] synthase family protein [Solimonas sp.]|nr:beta-ketoacyl-[acyl-carrier-protein] synthase family protein [Solimonas sp.]